MWFKKLSLKAAALVLAGVASSVAQSGISPMTFGDASTDVNNWNYLTQYKLWGTDGIQLGNRPGFYDPEYFDKSTMSYPPDVDLLSLGAVGTLKNLSSVGDGGWLDGPIVVGGNITNSGQNFEILTGPIRTNGSNAAIVRSGVQTCNLTASTGKCDPSITPDYRSNIKVPTLSGVSWGGALSVGNNPDKRTVIDVSSACSGSNCDLFYSSINFENDSRLVISIPDKHIARIFTKSLNLKTHPEIVVRDPNKGDLTPSEYKGNLLIYVDGDITFENIDNVQIMGTLVSNGTLTMKCNMIISGQFIANKIVIGNEIDAKNFTFTPIHPTPKLVVDNKSKKIKEGDDWYALDVVLDGESDKVVTFDYCFDFYNDNGTSVSGVYAGFDDVAKADASHKFPICNKGESEKGEIPVGKTKATGISIKALVDGLIEDDEALWFQVNNISGAELSSDYEKGFGYKIYIVSNDEFPTVKSALKFDVNEDEKHTFTKAEFQFQHATQEFASVIITNLPNKGSLSYNGTKITSVGSGKTIAVADLGKLTYQAASNEFGNSYATFKYKVVGDGVDGGNTSKEYTATVNVIPVNDKPTVADAVFTVNELDHAVAGGPIVITDVSNERNVDTYAYKLVNVTGSDYAAFNSVFEISQLSNQNLTIKVKSGAVLNYTTKNTYVVYATVTDDAATETKVVAGSQTSAEFKITVTIKNENDAPTIENQTFTIAEKNTDGSDWPSGTLVGNVSTASDPDGDPLTYSIVTTGVPFKFDNGSNQLVITDGSVLDYETKPTWTFKVQISDGELTATATVTVNLEDVDEPSPSIVFDYEGDVLVDGNTSTGDAVDNFTSNNSQEIQDQLSEIVKDLSYTIASNASANVTDYFNIDTESGEITAKTELIFEALYPNYTFTIGIDATGLNASAEPVSVNISKKIVIKDVNEAPVITNEEPLVVSESVLSKGGIVGKVEAVDPDSCSYNPLYVCANGSHPLGFNKLSYKIVEVLEVDGSTDFPFEIDLNTGVISVSKGPSLVKRYNYDYTSVVRKAAPLNSTKQKKYQFIVEVTDCSSDSDNAPKSVQKLMSIDITEENTAPVFESIASDYEVSENTSVGETFGDAIQIYDEDVSDVNGLTVSIADKDECDIEKNCTQTLFEVVQDGETDEESHISNFVFKVKSDLDYEALYKEAEGKATFNVTVIVTDGANHSVTSDVVIHVNDVDEEPTLENDSYEFTVAENTTIDDSNPIGTVAAKDPDVFNSTYGTISYNLEGDDAVFFAINASGGITMKEEYTLDYETRTLYSFNAIVSDGTTTKTASVKVNVTDVNEAPIFVEPTKTLAFSENEMGAVIDTLAFDDFDIASEFRNNKFECTNCDDYGFELNENTGELKTTRTFDYETDAHSYDLNIVIKDAENADLAATGTVTVHLNDVQEAPVFSNSIETIFTVDEDALVGKVVGTVTATDDDCKGDFSETCAKPTYSLSPFVGSEANSDVFTIDGDGNIMVAGTLDFDTKSVYEYHVIATDGENADLSSSIDVTINIFNITNKPTITDDGKTGYDVAENTVDYNTPTGKEIACYVVEDKDPNQVAKLKPSLIDLGSTKASTLFDAKIKKDGSAYKLCLVVKDGDKLDYETVAHMHKVQIYVTDPDLLSADITKTINITDVNEKPSISGSLSHFFYEHTGRNYLVGQLYAEDADTAKAFTNNFFSIVAGDTALFSITGNGLIKTKRDFDYEKESRYVYNVSVVLSDGDSKNYPNLKDTAVVQITLKDSPNDPVSSSSSKPVSSSSSKPASSSSKTNVASSSSKVNVASSSSQFVVEPESSASSSNSNASEYAAPTFRVRMVAPFVFEIVMDEALPSLAKQYAVMDMKGQVISAGELSEGATRVTVSTRGAYVVRVGLGYQRVNVK